MNRREQILQAVKSRLESIAAGESYGNDLAGRVHLRLTGDLDNTAMPAVVIMPESSDSQKIAGRVRETTHRLSIAAVTYGPDRIEAAGSIIDDILAALAADPTFDGLADGSEITAVEDEAIRAAKEYYALKIAVDIRAQTGLWQI